MASPTEGFWTQWSPHVHAGALWMFCALFLVLARGEAAGSPALTDGVRIERLANGFTLVLKEDHSAPVLSLQLWVKTGSANETAKEAGITHLIEHMIFKGTPTRKTGEIARTIESSGGRINAYTSLDRTVYFLELPSAHARTGVEILLDAVQHSLFDPGELALEKEVVLEEYRRYLDMPQSRLDWALMGLAYTKHPYRRPIIGYEKTIASLDRKAILAYISRWYTAENMVLVGVGDFDAGDLMAQVRPLVKGMHGQAGRQPKRVREPPQKALRKTVLSGRVQQVYLDLAWHVPELGHKDLPALEVLGTILGNGRSSRFYDRLKMRNSLVYSVNAGLYALQDPGLFSVSATLDQARLQEALGALGEEISRVRSAPVTGEELARARAATEAHFVYELETMAGQARTLGFFQVMLGDVRQADQYLDRVKKVTPEDILRVAGTYLGPGNLSVGVMAPEGSDVALREGDLEKIFAEAAPLPVVPEKATRAAEQVQLVTLDNGMRILVLRDGRVPAVSFTAAMMGGVRAEPPQLWGVSGFAARMLTRGTEKRSAARIASVVESLAGSLEGFSGRNSIGVSGRFLKEDLYTGLEILADVLLHPSFPEDQMEKVRTDTLAGIKAKEDRPMALLMDLFNETLFARHPYGHPLSGTPETIQGLTRETLSAWYASLVSPKQCVLAIVGDVNPEALIPYVKALFTGFPVRETEPLVTPPEPPLLKPREASLRRPLAQTHMALGYLDVSVGDPLNAPMTLVETALSGQGGRLFRELRDRLSLAYAVDAFRDPGLETGGFGLYLACDPQKVETGKKALFAEIEKLRRDGLDDRELGDAKAYFLGNLQISRQTHGAKAIHMALDELYGLGYAHLDHFEEEIRKVTGADIRRAVDSLLSQEAYVLVTVGP